MSSNCLVELNLVLLKLLESTDSIFKNMLKSLSHDKRFCNFKIFSSTNRGSNLIYKLLERPHSLFILPRI